MASITIQHGHKNLIFAAQVANETGARFQEEGQYIVISDTPQLEIPRYAFDQAFDPDGRRGSRYDTQLESAWRSLLLNKRGYLIYFGDNEIVLSDDKPSEAPSFLLRFHTAAEKERMEDMVERGAYTSANEFVLNAIARYIDELERGPGPQTDAPERHDPYRDRQDGRQVLIVAVYEPGPDSVDRRRVIEALQVNPLGSFFSMPEDEFHADFEEMI